MNEMFNKCMLCPRHCCVNRNNNQLGFCKCGNKIKIAKAYLHKWEEPCISGEIGSGTIFFSGCNMRCLFCQNYFIGEMNNGVEISTLEFANECIRLQSEGAANINLVTGCMYIPLIVEGIKIAKEKGLNIPIVYNSSGYEDVDALKLLEGIVDIYLPDFKYYDEEYAMKYSLCNDYVKNAKLALSEMYRQQPKCLFNEDGIMSRGVIVRHLMIPSLYEDSKNILNYLYRTYKNNIFYSIMNQYTPVRKLKYEELNNTISQDDYNNLINYAWDLGIRNAFVQEEGTVSESFIPKWDYKKTE